MTTSTVLRFLARAACAALAVCVAQASSYYVDNAAQFNAAVDKTGASFATLYAGDRVYLKGGNWDGLRRTLIGSMKDAEAQANPAVIYACDINYTPTIGGVTVDGLSQIQLAGTGITFTGVTFSPKSGMYKAGNYTDYSGNDNTAYIFNMPALSRYMTISHVKFDHCGDHNTDYANNDHYGAWVLVYGYRHTVQYCEIEGRSFDPSDYLITDPALINRRKSIRQATFVIYKSDDDTTDWGYHSIRYNYFGERLVPASGDSRLYAPADGSPISELSNGWETIRVGNGSLVSVDLNTTVEYNTFYHTLQAVGGGVNEDTGEPEICSNKSRKNTYRYNTFLNSYGQLTLRNGDYGVVQGNYFLAGGAYDATGNIVLTEARNNQMGGVRVIGFGHTVSNNYFYRLNGTNAKAALCLYRGFTDPGTLAALINSDGSTNYETANYSQIFGNTFIDCKEITLDYDNGDPTESIFPIYGTQFINNLVYYGSNIGGNGIIGQSTDSIANRGGLARGNYVYSATAGQLGTAASMLGTTGNTITGSADPALTSSYNSLPIPASSSPLIGAAAALPVIYDTSPEAANYNLAGNVVTYGGVDMRGLARPATGSDIGAYEREASGAGARPLRRSEVGRVAASFPAYPLVTDLFSDGTRDATGDGQSPPFSLRWFCSGATGANTIVSGPNGTLALTGSTASLSTRQAFAYFPAQTLAIGEVITLSFQFKVTAPLNATRGLRAALLSNGLNTPATSDAGANPTTYTGTGYGTFINPAPAAANPVSIVERSDASGTIVTTPVGIPWATTSSGGAQQSLVAGTSYFATLTVRRTSATSVSLTTTYRGGALAPATVNATDSTGSFTFDTVAFGVGNTTVGSITYSDITIAKTMPLVALPGTADGALNSAVDIPLQNLVSTIDTPFAARTFSVSAPVGGTVALLADGLTARFTPATGFQGTASFAYGVTDGVTSAASVVSIAYANSPPVIGAVASTAINEDAATTAIAFTVSDDFTAASALTVTAISSNSALVPLGNIALGGTGANRTVTLTPAANQNGTTMITLTVSDGVLTANSIFVLTVRPVNDAPAAAAGLVSASLNQAVDVDLWSFVSDLETANSGLEFTVSGAANGTAVLLPDGHTVRFTPAPNYSGPATFDYAVTDVAPDSRVLLNYSFQPPDVITDGICSDVSGNGRDGAVSAAAGAGVGTYIADYPAALFPNYNQSLNFYQNGNTDATKLVCGLGGTSVINLQTADWTASGWFKRSSTPTDQDILFHLGSGIGNGGSGNELTLAFFDNTTPTTALTLKNWNSTLVSTSYTNDVAIGTTATSGAWHHFAIVRSGTTLRLFLDGVSKGTDNVFALTFDPAASVIFGSTGGSASTYSRALNGSMADLAIFNAALSAADINRIYTAPVALLGSQAAENTVTVNVKQVAMVVLLGLARTYDGLEKSVTATTSPEGLPVVFTYDGSPGAPTAPGVYTVVGIVDSGTHQGTATGTLVVTDSIISWREAFFGDGGNGGAGADDADFDGDGFVNATEYVFGTDPTKADGGAGLYLAASGGDLALSFVARAASGVGYIGRSRHYALESNGDFSRAEAWTPMVGFADILGAGQTITTLQTINGASVFFRLHVWLQ
jgi:hypothetical protein